MAEAIAARDWNHLYRTSCYFADEGRYRAFCAMYAVMRVIDDRVDAARVDSAHSCESKRRDQDVLDAWAHVVASSLAGHSPSRDDLAGTESESASQLADAFVRSAAAFPVPAVIWSNFFAAMRRDLEMHPFARYEEFLEYAEGAAVAPTTIYLYLIAADRQRDDPAHRSPPGFDLLSLGRELGRFAYLAHVLRDLARDLATGEWQLVCLAADDMARHGVSRSQLEADLASGRASPGVRALVKELADRAWRLIGPARTRMRMLERMLSTDRGFVLELIVRTYEEILRKIAACSYDPMTDSHRLTETEKRGIALQVAAQWRPNAHRSVNDL